MKNKANNITLKILVLAVLFTAASFIFYLATGNKKEGVRINRLDAFAECLRGQGIVMYGADWCPHCQNEKRAFGDSFRLLNYVECPKQPQRCLAAGVRGYPTWIFPDGRKLEGEQGIEKLAKESGCPLPE